MKKVPSLKSFHSKQLKNHLNYESSTQLSDYSGIQNSHTIFELSQKSQHHEKSKPTKQKIISRTSSVPFLGEPPKYV